jgi:hypothetical protein
VTAWFLGGLEIRGFESARSQKLQKYVFIVFSVSKDFTPFANILQGLLRFADAALEVTQDSGGTNAATFFMLIAHFFNEHFFKKTAKSNWSGNRPAGLTFRLRRIFTHSAGPLSAASA